MRSMNPRYGILGMRTNNAVHAPILLLDEIQASQHPNSEHSYACHHKNLLYKSSMDRFKQFPLNSLQTVFL
jgi:hypothetical protein